MKASCQLSLFRKIVSAFTKFDSDHTILMKDLHAVVNLIDLTILTPVSLVLADRSSLLGICLKLEAEVTKSPGFFLRCQVRIGFLSVLMWRPVVRKVPLQS